MGSLDRMRIHRIGRWAAAALIILVFSFIAAISAAAQRIDLNLDPSQTSVQFTLKDVLHTVHGTFRLKQGALQFDSGSGKVSGEIVVDAQSGDSGSSMRDRKMHREVLESETYPDISFRPIMVEGNLVDNGSSLVRVQGTFRIHGVDREISVPAVIQLSADHWIATVHFTVPYAKWGMKNPSTLFLRVEDTVAIDVSAAGRLVRAAGAASAQ